MPIQGKPQVPSCPSCGKLMIERHRRSDGKLFWGCSGFPGCRGIVNWGEEAKVAPKVKFPEPSEYQREIIKFGLEGTGNAVVIANAGCAKTTTNMMLGAQLGNFLGIAFNTHIAKEWAQKQPQAEIRTTHSLGLWAIRSIFPDVKIDDRKLDNIINPMVEAQPLEWEDQKALAHVVKQVCDLSKATLSDDFPSLIDRYGINTNGDENLVFMMTKMALEQDQRMPKVVDFGDMLWLPYVLNIAPPKFDFVLADEAQDFNRAQAELALASLNPSGRIIAVGDPFQSIYGFRGADVDSIPNLIERLNAITLPLPICYRCPKRVIELAQVFVPEIQAAPWAEDGIVDYLPEAQAMMQVVAGDMILCRTNAPLVRPIYQLIRNGVKATIRGRDIGEGLIVLIEKFEPKSISLMELLSKINQYADRELGKLLAREKNNQAQILMDKVETIYALSDGCETIQGLKDKTSSIFNDRNAAVVGSTVHRAKGLEADNVYIIRPDLMPHPMAKKDWEMQQEANLMYVCVTRAKKRLVYAFKE